MGMEGGIVGLGYGFVLVVLGLWWECGMSE
jgi:hypothetical protein